MTHAAPTTFSAHTGGRSLRRRARLLAQAAASVLLCAAAPALADAADASDAGVDEVIVTGTRAAERTASQSAVPVDVIGADALRTVASRDLNDQLAQLVPSFNVQRIPGFDGANFVRPATLRGLSPDQTLVLIDGKRRHRSAYIQIQQFGAQSVDLSEIPQIAIRQVQVLRDGASAQYGSDAIAGVINILLEDRPGGLITAQGSQYYEGDGRNLQLAGRIGTKLGESGRINVSAEYNDANRTNRSTEHDPSGQPALRTFRSFVNLAYDLGPAEVYAFGNYGHAKGEYVFGWRNPTGTLFNPSFFQTNAPFTDANYRLADRYPNGFNPHFLSTTRDVSAVGGVRGKVGEVSWDLSGRAAQNRIDYRVENSINASLGSLSPTEFDAGAWVQSEQAVNLDLSYLWDVGFSAPVTVSFGGEWRREAFELKAGELASYVIGPLSDLVPGSNSYPGPSPVQAGKWDRDSYAAYVDLDADVTERLNLGVAGRLESFSDFGETWNFKVSGRYSLTDWLNLRGAISSGFHAPTPGQQNLTNTTQGPDPLRPPPAPQVILTSGLVPPTNPVAASVGGQALKPEKADNYSVGLVVRPAAGFIFSLDFYRIDIDDRLGITQSITLTPAQRTALLAAGVKEASSLDNFRFFINGYSTRTDGVDLVAAWSGEAGPGRLGLQGVFNHTHSKITGGDPRVVNDALRAEIEDRRPRNVGSATATYDVGPLSLLARVRYYGPWTDALQFLPASYYQRVAAEAFVDLSATYAVTPKISVTAGVENLFDNYPDGGGPLAANGVPYPLLRPYEADGGRYYLRVSAAF